MNRVALRPLLIPPEHGSWAFLLEPLAVGLLIAPTATGFCIALGAIAAFLARHPLLLALRDRKHGKRYPRTAVCERIVVVEGAVAVAAFVLAIVAVGWMPLLPLLFALPFTALHFAFPARSRGSELFGAIASASTVAAIALAAQQSAIVAVALWSLLAARAVVSILYVRSALGGESRALMLAAHVIAVLVAAILAFARIAPFGAPLAMLVLLLRAIPRRELPARSIGIREVGYGAVTVLLLAI